MGEVGKMNKLKHIARRIGAAPLGLALVVVLAAVGVLAFRAGVLPGPLAPGAGGPRTAVQLSSADLPGPVYDLAFDQARDSLWYAFMLSGEPVALYRYDIASGKTSHWSLPSTDYNGFLSRVVVAPDGSVWLTENYTVVRVDPVSGSVLKRTFTLADPDANSTAASQNDLSPGTWPTAITFDSAGMALVARHNVKSLVRFDSSLAEVDRVQLPGSIVGPGDLVDSGGVIYAAPYHGAGPGVVFSEKGALIGETTDSVSRFAVSGDGVVAMGSAGLSRVESNAVSTLWHTAISGGPEERFALTTSGAALYLDGPGTIQWISPGGGVEGELSLPWIPIQVANPGGKMVPAYTIHHVGAIAADTANSVWYVDITSYQLVHISL
jgi:hypothetical protein